MNQSVDVNLTKEFLNSATIQVALDVSSKEFTIHTRLHCSIQI